MKGGQHNEKELLCLIAGGDHGAFTTLFQHYESKIFSVAKVITHSGVIGEELVQEIFLTIWKNREKLSSIDDFESYLFIITRNASMRELQRIAKFRGRMKSASIPIATSNEVEQFTINREYTRMVHNVVSALPMQQQQVFRLTHEEGLSRKQTAVLLHISPESVKTHLSRAIKAIRKRYIGQAFAFIILLSALL